MWIRAIFITSVLLFSYAKAHSFESDVHFGLTKWLALKAGFSEQQADYIALGNQRTDSGTMDSIQLTLEYACLGNYVDSSKVAQFYHYPSKNIVPASPIIREISAGSSEARREISRVLAAARIRNGEHLLLKLGEALHLFQDSWAYQGVSDVPRFDSSLITCAPDLVWAAPKERGGFDSHKADWTWRWPTDVAEMAKSTYEVLVEYNALINKKIQYSSWEAIQPHLKAFIDATSKHDKRIWFRSQGIEDVDFLGMVTLPDGGSKFVEIRNRRKIAALRNSISSQHTVERELKLYFDEFFKVWLGSDRPETAIASPKTAKQRDVAARLKLWRIRDHGLVASLAHQRKPLDQAQLEKVSRITKKNSAYVNYVELKDAFFPLLEQGPGASPLLPYVIHNLPFDSMSNPKAIAVVKLKHLPYDELGIVAERVKGNWSVVEILSLVSH